jgi:hypothetical protein
MLGSVLSGTASETIRQIIVRNLAQRSERSRAETEIFWEYVGLDLGCWTTGSQYKWWNLVVEVMFDPFITAMQGIGDETVLPYIHIVLAGLRCLSLIPDVMKLFECYIPWSSMVSLLNSFHRETGSSKPGIKTAPVSTLDR